MQVWRNASLVGLSPEIGLPSASVTESRAGSRSPSEALVGVISMRPSPRRTLILPVEPGVSRRSNSDLPTLQISSRRRVSSESTAVIRAVSTP
jgi:hypothetical protein